MTMIDAPRPIGIFLCERVLRDVLRPDSISCINMHNMMTVQAFPAVLPLVFAYAEVTGSDQDFTYQFKFVDRKGTELATSNVQKVSPLPNKYMTHKLIGAFQGLVFPDEGSYILNLALDGKDVTSMAFQVLHFAPESSA